MATIQHISVKVCGNPASNSGFVPILLFNNPSFAIEDQFYVGFDNCSFFYTIKTTNQQTIYTLVKNNVRSYGATRAGSLIIAFSVPKNYAIEGGYTPYYILGKLKDEFLKKCMTCKDPIRETYEFNPGLIDQHVLDDVAKEFTLTPHPTPERVMNPSAPKGYIVKTDAEIEKLFHDTNYPEFDNYNEVIVAETVNQTSYTLIKNIQIPRPIVYDIYVDGEKKESIADLEKKITVRSGKFSEYYENHEETFTIGELKNGNYIPGIEFQEVNERIVISTKNWAKPKIKKINIKIIPEKYEDYFKKNPQLLRLSWPYGDGKINVGRDLSFTLEGEKIAELSKGTIQFSLEPNEKYKLVKVMLNNDEISVSVEEKKDERITYPATKSNSHVCDITITLKNDKEYKNDFNKDIKVLFQSGKESNDNNVKNGALFLIRFYPKSNKYEGNIKVYNEVVRNYPYLCLKSNNFNFTLKEKLHWESNKTAYKDNDFTISKSSLLFKWRLPIFCITTSLATLFFGLFLGFLISGSRDTMSIFNDKNKQGNDSTTNNEYAESVATITKEQANAFFQKADSLLKTKDLKFEVVNKLYAEQEKYKDIADIEDRDKICDRINDYHTIVQYISHGKIEDIETAIQGFPGNGLHIWQQHADQIKKILKNEDFKKQFRNNYSNITGFNDIEKHITNNNNSGDASKTATPNNTNNKKSNEIPKKAATASTER